jgi:hypothetical protein
VQVVALAMAEKVPAGHDEQVVTPELEYEPALHAPHDETPTELEALPAGHWEQIEAPARENLPTPQVEQ